MGMAKVGNRRKYIGLFTTEDDANVAIFKRENELLKLNYETIPTKNT